LASRDHATSEIDTHIFLEQEGREVFMSHVHTDVSYYEAEVREEHKPRRVDLVLLTITGVLAAAEWLGFLHPPLPQHSLAVLSTLISGVPILKRALGKLKHRHISSEFAMVIGMTASSLVGEYLSASVIGFFTLLGEAISAFTTDKSRGAISELVKLAPKRAWVKRDGEYVEVDIDQLEVGDRVLIRSRGENPSRRDRRRWSSLGERGCPYW